MSSSLRLRVNLTALENIALIRQYHAGLSWSRASAEAQQLLDLSGHGDCAMQRDEDLTSAQRFAVKLARAISQARPLLVIDRPALMLPDMAYPRHLAALLESLSERLPDYRILDFDWHKPLYASLI